MAHQHGDFRLGGALIFPQLRQPTVAPVLGALGLPKNRATGLAARADDALYHVATMLALGDGLDDIEREFGAQQVFKLQLLYFALQLLRALFGLAFKFLDLLLHRGDGLFLFLYLEVQLVFRFFFGFLPGGGKTLLYAFLNRQFQFAFGVIQFALLLDEFRLCVLRFGQFFFTAFQHFL